MNNNQNQGQEKHLTIQPSEIQEFEYPFRTGYASTTEICMRINTLFSEVFCDFTGSFIGQNNGLVFIVLTFGEPRVGKDNLPRAFRPIQVNLGSNIGQTAMNLSRYASRHRAYEITKEGSDVLSQFVFQENPKNKWHYDADRLTMEKANTQYIAGSVRSTISIEASGFDVDKVLRRVFPDIQDNEIIIPTPLRVINNVNGRGTRYTNLLYSIQVIDLEKYDNIGAEYGIGSNQAISTGNSEIVTAVY